jgi:hypothetical protein
MSGFLDCHSDSVYRCETGGEYPLLSGSGCVYSIADAEEASIVAYNGNLLCVQGIGRYWLNPLA